MRRSGCPDPKSVAKDAPHEEDPDQHLRHGEKFSRAGIQHIDCVQMQILPAIARRSQCFSERPRLEGTSFRACILQCRIQVRLLQSEDPQRCSDRRCCSLGRAVPLHFGITATYGNVEQISAQEHTLVPQPHLLPVQMSLHQPRLAHPARLRSLGRQKYSAPLG